MGPNEGLSLRTYDTRDSPVVTHPSTSLAIICLSRGERTGSRVLRCLWSYVEDEARGAGYTLEVAVRVGTPETVDLLLAHGARIEYARPLHLLIRRPAAPPPNDRQGTRARQLSPPPSAAAAAPDPARFQFANHLVRRGVGVNAFGNAYVFFRVQAHDVPDAAEEVRNRFEKLVKKVESKRQLGDAS
ncbi:hypothetical protein NKR19_g359 [Coniochaeta hoffmannii]|uniref:Ankyrin n=1 Tax=Coniochaeta hoffmannii TaxID=91930 RepID=A0AA38VU28_9PEZI|nr:hypothetical protein NKR19_g359 [Coniochaeta hoffmannii]